MPCKGVGLIARQEATSVVKSTKITRSGLSGGAFDQMAQRMAATLFRAHKSHIRFSGPIGSIIFRIHSIG